MSSFKFWDQSKFGTFATTNGCIEIHIDLKWFRFCLTYCWFRKIGVAMQHDAPVDRCLLYCIPQLVFIHPRFCLSEALNHYELFQGQSRGLGTWFYKKVLEKTLHRFANGSYYVPIEDVSQWGTCRAYNLLWKYGFSSRKILCPDNFETPCAKYSCWSWCSRSYKGQNGYLLSYRALNKILQDDSWLMDNFVTNVWRIVTQDPVVLVVDFISWTWVMNFDCDVMRQIFFPQQVHR